MYIMIFTQTDSDTVRSSFRCETIKYGDTENQIYEIFDNDISGK